MTDKPPAPAPQPPLHPETKSDTQPVTVRPQQTNAAKQPPTLNVNNLGYFLDGWADLIEGMGEKVDEVRASTIEGLRERDLPGVNVNEAMGYVSFTTNEKRHYGLTTTDPGATTTIYIAKQGKDLYASWRTFIHPVVNGGVVVILLIVSLVLGLIMGGIQKRTDFYGNTNTSLTFFGWILGTILFLVIGCVIVAFISRISKGDFLALFFIEPSIFDAEDITAMGLAAHKSILRALDKTGIDVSKLRLKQNFKGGRRGEDV